MPTVDDMKPRIVFQPCLPENEIVCGKIERWIEKWRKPVIGHYFSANSEWFCTQPSLQQFLNLGLKGGEGLLQGAQRVSQGRMSDGERWRWKAPGGCLCCPQFFCIFLPLHIYPWNSSLFRSCMKKTMFPWRQWHPSVTQLFSFCWNQVINIFLKSWISG